MGLHPASYPNCPAWKAAFNHRMCRLVDGGPLYAWPKLGKLACMQDCHSFRHGFRHHPSFSFYSFLPPLFYFILFYFILFCFYRTQLMMSWPCLSSLAEIQLQHWPLPTSSSHWSRLATLVHSLCRHWWLWLSRLHQAGPPLFFSDRACRLSGSALIKLDPVTISHREPGRWGISAWGWMCRGRGQVTNGAGKASELWGATLSGPS